VRRGVLSGQPICRRLPDRDVITATLIKIWQDVLGVSQPDPTGNFFDLGGDSISVTQAVRRIREELGYNVSLIEIFDNPTVQDLALVVQANLTQGRYADTRSTQPG
jgi:acyl carrier protein